MGKENINTDFERVPRLTFTTLKGELFSFYQIIQKEPPISHLMILPSPEGEQSIGAELGEYRKRPILSIVPDPADDKKRHITRSVKSPDSGMSLEELKERFYAPREAAIEYKIPRPKETVAFTDIGTEDISAGLESGIPSFIPPPPEDGSGISGYNFLEDIEANLASVTEAESAAWKGMDDEQRIDYLKQELARRWKEGKSTKGEEFHELSAGISELASKEFEKRNR